MTVTLTLTRLLALCVAANLLGWLWCLIAMAATRPGPGKQDSHPDTPPPGPHPAGLPRAGRFPLLLDSYPVPDADPYPTVPLHLVSDAQAALDRHELEIRELGYAAAEAFPEYQP